MGEFGHDYGSGDGLRFDRWGAGPFIIADENGKQYRFEDSDRFGPSLIGSKGDPLTRQPGEHSPFWRVHRIWVQQGRRTSAGGIDCLWDEPRPMTVKMLSKRVGIVVEHGEPDGKVIHRPVGKPGKP
jgi:hypothetical protein